MQAATNDQPMPRSWLAFDGVLVRRIVALAGPTVAAMISQTLINIADHIMVGRIQGSFTINGVTYKESVAGQAALGPALAMMWLVGGAMSAISVGTQALTARRYGEGDHKGAGQVLANSSLVALLMGTIAATVCALFTHKIFPILSKDPGVLAVGVPFLRWRYIGVLSMVLTASYKSFFDGLGQTRVHFVVAVVMNIINFILNLGLIFGLFGLPAMGVEGSGLASCISSYIGCAMIVAWSFRREIREQYQPYRFANLVNRVRTEILRLSAPSALAVVVSIGGFGAFYAVCGYLDRQAHHTDAIFLSATTNIINILMLVFISCIAYGSACSTLVGQGLGAKDPDLAERSAIEAAKLGALVFVVLGAFTVAFPTLILHGWTADAPVIEVAAPVLRVLGFFEPFVCVALVFMYALYGAGDSLFIMACEGILHPFCLIPLSWLFGVVCGWALWGVWAAMLTYVVLMTCAMTWRFLRGKWKKIEI